MHKFKSVLECVDALAVSCLAIVVAWILGPLMIEYVGAPNPLIALGVILIGIRFATTCQLTAILAIGGVLFYGVSLAWDAPAAGMLSMLGSISFFAAVYIALSRHATGTRQLA